MQHDPNPNLVHVAFQILTERDLQGARLADYTGAAEGAFQIIDPTGTGHRCPAVARTEMIARVWWHGKLLQEHVAELDRDPEVRFLLRILNRQLELGHVVTLARVRRWHPMSVRKDGYGDRD